MRWLLINVNTDPSIYCLENGESISLDVNGSVVCYAYESANSGSSITVAILKAITRDEPDHMFDMYAIICSHSMYSSYIDIFVRFIEIYSLQFDLQHHSCAVSTMRKAQCIYIPTSSIPSSIELKGPLVALSTDGKFFIANWQERSGVALSPTHGGLEEWVGVQV